MWRELVYLRDSAAICAPAASKNDIDKAEKVLNISFPADFCSLLSEANGIVGEYGPYYIWPIDIIIQQNLTMRTDAYYRENHMPFDHLLFFANAGADGILFAFPILQQRIPSPSPVYYWEPLEDNRIRVAKSLEDYLTRWLDGSLTV